MATQRGVCFRLLPESEKGLDRKHPIFTGRFASGRINDRFLYLSWRVIKRGDYINRAKARLGTTDWKMVRVSHEQDRPITADMTGWNPGRARKNFTGYLG